LTFGAPRADAILFAVAFRAAQARDRPSLFDAKDLAAMWHETRYSRLFRSQSPFPLAGRGAWPERSEGMARAVEGELQRGFDSKAHAPG
jgi:hypothetical protein